jgi:hypothetical protein
MAFMVKKQEDIKFEVATFLFKIKSVQTSTTTKRSIRERRNISMLYYPRYLMEVNIWHHSLAGLIPLKQQQVSTG